MEKVIEKVFNGFSYASMVMLAWGFVSFLDIGMEINKLPFNLIKIWYEWAVTVC